ncbi:MAG: clostripain-related cysteine peptidase [Roseiflexaceae bacterium]
MSEASWTWMIYLATHNNAAEVGEESVARMRTVAPNPNVRVLVQQSTLERTTRHVIGASPEIAADLGKVDSGAPETLLDFIRWAAATAPARRYALVLWSHGSGWTPSEMERIAKQQPAAVPVTAGELIQRGQSDTAGQIFFSSSLGELLAQPTPSERAIAFDDGSGHSLDTLELGRAIAKAAQALGRPLDLVGMNACQMSSAEVAYQLRGSAEVYVASQEDMPVQGWPYDDILPRLAAQPDMDAAALGTLVVERYLAYFQANQLPWGQDGLPAGVTLAATRLDGIPKLAGAVQSLAACMQGNIATLSDAVWAAHAKAHKFKFQLYDLASFCRALANAASGTPAAAAANAVLTALDDPALMLKRAHLGSTYDDIGGLTTYLLPPGTGKPISPYYAETAYAQATAWGAFLAAYHAAVG